MDNVISAIAIMAKFLSPLFIIIVILNLIFCWILIRRHKQIWDSLFPDSLESGNFLGTYGDYIYDKKFDILNDKFIAQIGRLINYSSLLFKIVFGMVLFIIFVWPFLSNFLEYLFPGLAPYLSIR
jgi:hypothetical protein